jgi:hypothetical protein
MYFLQNNFSHQKFELNLDLNVSFCIFYARLISERNVEIMENRPLKNIINLAGRETIISKPTPIKFPNPNKHIFMNYEINDVLFDVRSLKNT